MVFPFSHRFTVAKLTPRMLAKTSWVSCKCSRSALIALGVITVPPLCRLTGVISEHTRPPHGCGQPESFQPHNDPPPHIYLPHRPPQARRARPGVVIAMPVLALKTVPHRQPVDIAAGVFPHPRARAQMAHTIDKTLPVEGEHQTYGAQPEERGTPARKAAKEREREQRHLQSGPGAVGSVLKIGAVPYRGGVLRLPQPPQVRPPEPPDTRAGNIFGGIRRRVMQAVVRGPRERGARAIVEGKKDEKLADDGMQPERAVGEGPMIADRGAQAPQPRQCPRHQEEGPARERE